MVAKYEMIKYKELFKLSTVWKYVNETTGSEMECNDLEFMISKLVKVNGLRITNVELTDLILKGELARTVLDSEGNEHSITIREIKN